VVGFINTIVGFLVDVIDQIFKNKGTPYQAEPFHMMFTKKEFGHRLKQIVK
jgi:hypothetical protein